ncbi:MAG: VTT domain-containing protein [Acidibacillus sp.]|nr:VTT domain-containing protein [Acidibacillus sp.]
MRIKEQSIRADKKRKQSWLVPMIILISIFMVALFFYFDQQNGMTLIIRSWGISGVIIGILLMGIICMTPIPSEGLLLIFLKIYGIFLGLLYAWIGSSIGAIAIFILARSILSPMFKELIGSLQQHRVEQWVKKRGVSGLLFVRLLPIPAFVVNYTVGLLPGVGFFQYLWTAIVSMAPYYAGTIFMFLGIVNGIFSWILIGLFIVIILFILSFIVNRNVH